MRALMSLALPAPSMMVLFSFSTTIFLASPRSFSVAFSSCRPTIYSGVLLCDLCGQADARSGAENGEAPSVPS
jgi:hypothetical protein